MDKEMSLKNRDRLIQLGITISTFRKYRGLSQEQLAELAEVHRTTISAIEREKFFPTIDNAARIANALNLTIAELFDFNF